MQPPLTEKENVTILRERLSLTYYDRLIGLGSAFSPNLVQRGERIEDRLRPVNLKTITHFTNMPRVVMVGYPKGPFRAKKSKATKRKSTLFQNKYPRKSLALRVLLLPTNCLLPMLFMPRDPSIRRQHIPLSKQISKGSAS